jgi:dimethylamine monooxygenase subunit B
VTDPRLDPRLDLVVAAIDDRVPAVRRLTLVAPDGGELPGFTPGSHLVVECALPDGVRANAYSLTGESLAPTSYAVSVLRVGDDGGSAWVHALAVGDKLVARRPRSAFAPVARATRHLLVAGGIGVTPVVSHLRAARAWGRETQVLYAHRAGSGAHLDDLADLAPDAELFTDRSGLLDRLETVLTDQPIGTHLYVCGPAAMIDAVSARAAALGWPASRVHVERFGVDALDPGDPFRAVLTASGTELDVPSGVSLLEALEAAGHDVPHLCRQGVCGECRVPVAGGTPLHRDLFLTDDERAAGDCLMACVSRSSGPLLEVAL